MPRLFADEIATNPNRIAFIGGGNMARSLIGALIRGGTSPMLIAVAEPHEERRAALAHDFRIAAMDRAHAIESGAGTLVLAVKPQVMKAVCGELADYLRAARPLIVSIAAGVKLADIDRWLGGGFPVVRCMPNLPAIVGAAAAGLIANSHVDAIQRKRAQAILDAAGISVWIDDEALMDVVTALSGSGPAYFALLAEALEDGAVAEGLPRETARTLAMQTCLGAGRLLVDGEDTPASLRERVTSPGGTTAAALKVFDDGGLRKLIANGVAAATARGRELSRGGE